MNNTIYSQIFALPVEEVARMHRVALPKTPMPSKKSGAAAALADLCQIQSWTFQTLVNHCALKQGVAESVTEQRIMAKLADKADLGTISNIESKASITQARADSAYQAAREAQRDIGALMHKIDTFSQRQQFDLDSIAQRVADVSKALAARPAVEIPQSEIEAQINRSITAAFGAFKSQVVAAGAEQVVADTAAAIACSQTIPTDLAFGLLIPDSKGNPLSVTHWNRTDAPAVDPHHIWHSDILRHLLLAEQAKGSTLSNLWLGGEKGAGKSETARQFAARTGRGFTRINFQRFTTVEDFLGATGLTNGSTEFVPGAFLKAYTTPGSVILLDEITNADPGVLNSLNGFLEPGAAVTYGGKVWTKAPGVVIMAADNTLGNGDQSGRYAGTRAQGAPLLNRFGQVVHLTFLPRDVEQAAVVSRTGCSDALAGHVLDAIAVARAKVQQGEIIDAPSIRNVIAFIEALRVLPVRAAWDATIAAAQPAESAVALQQVFESCINEKIIQSS
jgi:MoxR-like ATPase